MRLTMSFSPCEGERLALARIELGTADVSPGAPQDEFLQLYGVDEDGRINLQVWFDLEDIDAAIAELDADACAIRGEPPVRRGGWKTRQAERPSASSVLRSPRLGRDGESRRRHLQRRSPAGRRRRDQHGRDAEIANLRAVADVGITYIDVRGHRDPRRAPRPHSCPILGGDRDRRRSSPRSLSVVEIDPTSRSRRSSCSTSTTSTPPSPSSTRGTSPAKRPPTRTRGRSSRQAYAALNRRELPPTTPDWVNIDHRRGTSFAPGEMPALLSAAWNTRV